MTAVPRRAWTDAELGEVLDTLDRPRREVAERLGRSISQIDWCRHRIRSGWSPVSEAWTEADLIVIRETQSLPACDVATVLSRTVPAVYQARSKIYRSDPDYLPPRRVLTLGRRTLLAQTCTKCGVLLDASWFNRARSGKRRGMWAPECTRCHGSARNSRGRTEHELSKRSRPLRILQELSRRTATRRWEDYLTSEEGVLSDPDLSVFEKAIKLRRTYDGVAHRTRRSGYTSRVGLGDPANGTWVIDNPNERVA